MLAGGIFRQEIALRNANRAPESVGFLRGYRFASRASFGCTSRVTTGLPWREMVLDPGAQHP
ncbi:MAG TPA: hypothetical protein VER11_21700 [Polyangiaceae bacterium]|nr:hypothetical protein [Polyangiaceae bacterium]